MLVGDVVFKGEVSAQLKKYDASNAMSAEKPIIIYAYSLTTELAFYVINNPVVGILTEESSFATHGANILRCKQSSESQRIVWISGLNIKELSFFEGRIISLHEDGAVTLGENEPFHYLVKKSEKYLPSPMKKRCIVEYNLMTGHYKLCYWPHRIYNRLTYSIWKKGLEKNLVLFGVENPLIKRENSKIWLYDCPFISDYVRKAVDYTQAISMLNKQIELYHSFYLKLTAGDYSCSELVKMSSDYFSIFLLFHETYEDVFLRAYHLFEEHLNNNECYDVFNHMLQCKIDEWMLSENISLLKSKNFLSDEKVVPVPPFTIYTDIEETVTTFKEYLSKKGYDEFWNHHRRQLIFYNKCFVAKEWKFVMIKMISTRFSLMLKEKLPEMPFDKIADMHVDELETLLNK